MTVKGDGESSGETEVADASVRAVRAGHGANCSSIGSVVDILFAAATVGTALFAAVAAALASEPVRVANAPQRAASREASRDAARVDEEPRA